MKQKPDINKKIEDALQSLDGINRAAARPYLMTRINARLQQPLISGWDRLVAVVTRPVIAISGLCLVLMINGLAIRYAQHSSPAVEQAQHVDEFSNTIATIYEIDN